MIGFSPLFPPPCDHGARRKVVQDFAVSLVNERTIATYRQLLPVAVPVP